MLMEHRPNYGRLFVLKRLNTGFELFLVSSDSFSQKWMQKAKILVSWVIIVNRCYT